MLVLVLLYVHYRGCTRKSPSMRCCSSTTSSCC